MVLDEAVISLNRLTIVQPTSCAVLRVERTGLLLPVSFVDRRAGPVFGLVYA